MKKANSWPDEVLNPLESIFNETIELVYTVFGDNAFLAPENKKESKIPRKIIYDPLMQVFSINLVHKDRIIQKAETIKKNIYSNKKGLDGGRRNRVLFDGKYNGRKEVQSRIDYFENFLKECIS